MINNETMTKAMAFTQDIQDIADYFTTIGYSNSTVKTSAIDFFNTYFNNKMLTLNSVTTHMTSICNTDILCSSSFEVAKIGVENGMLQILTPYYSDYKVHMSLQLDNINDLIVLSHINSVNVIEFCYQGQIMYKIYLPNATDERLRQLYEN